MRRLWLLLPLALVGCKRPAAPPADSPPPSKASPAPAPARGEVRPPYNTLTPKEVAEGNILLFDGASVQGWHVEGEARAEGGLLKLGGAKATKAWPKVRLAQSGVETATSWKGTSPPVLRGGGLVLTLNDSTRDGKLARQSWGGGGHSLYSKDGFQVETYSTDRPFVAEVPAGSELWLCNVKAHFNEHRILRTAPARPRGQPIATWLSGPDGKPTWSDGPDGWRVLQGGPCAARSLVQFPHVALQMEAELGGARPQASIELRGPAGAKPNVVVTLEAGEDGKLSLVGLGERPRPPTAREGQPFHLTLVVCENDYAAWVNGLPVAEWSAGPAPKGATFARAPVVLRLPGPEAELRVRNVRYVKLIGDTVPREEALKALLERRRLKKGR